MAASSGWAAASAALLPLVLLASTATADAAVCDRVASPHGKIRTPQALVRRLGPGQVGCLRRGVYRRRQVVIRTPGVTVRSYPRERASWIGRVVLGAPRITLSNLNLDGRIGPPCRGRGCYPKEDVLPSPTVNGPRARLVGNDITNARGICVNIRSYYGLTPDRFRIERNRIHDCRPATNHVHGIYVVNGSRGLIRHNVVYDNGDKGIVLYPAARRERVEGNTIDGNRTSVHFGGGREHAASGNIVRSSILSFPTPHDGRPARFNVEFHWPGPVGRGNRVRRSCLYTTASDAYFAGDPAGSGVVPNGRGFAVDDAIVADPRYVDRASGDFRIPADSPCAGLGAPEEIAAADAWCRQVAPDGYRDPLYRRLWAAGTRCFGPLP